MRKSFRYKSKIGEEGCHSKFFKNHIIDKVNTFRGTLKNLPKPQNHAELAMLSKFIFGTELTLRFEYCEDKFAEAISEAEKPRYGAPTGKGMDKANLKFARYLKLIKIKDEDFVPKSGVPKNSNARCRNDKMILLYLRYFCNQKHNDTYDSRFNHVVFDTSYDVDCYFWRHCLGELCCGGISGSSYGQVEITSFKERERIMNLFTNVNEPVRRSFRKQIEKLIELDKEYDEKSMEV